VQLARVIGHAVSTVKHASLNGWRLLVVQPLGANDAPDGEPLLAIDSVGSALHDRVIVSNDGAGARQIVGSKTSPARWFVVGIQDR
jgi:microcompartment protein CcmK/EutM